MNAVQEKDVKDVSLVGVHKRLNEMVARADGLVDVTSTLSAHVAGPEPTDNAEGAALPPAGIVSAMNSDLDRLEARLRRVASSLSRINRTLGTPPL